MTVKKENFELKIKHIVKNLYVSHTYLKIHEWMTNEQNKNLSEYPLFFKWSRMAHYEAGVLRLARAYDSSNDSLGILKVLKIIQSNYRYWKCGEIDNRELDKDIHFLENDGLIKKLKHLRDKAIAHVK